MCEFLPPVLRYSVLIVLYMLLIAMYRGLVRASQAPIASHAAPSPLRAAGAASLVVVQAGDTSRAKIGRSVPVSPSTVIGRADDCTVRLDDDFASKEHCIIQLRDGNYMLSDLGSRNGTLVNGQRVIGVHRLAPGDQVDVGTTRLEFRA